MHLYQTTSSALRIRMALYASGIFLYLWYFFFSTPYWFANDIEDHVYYTLYTAGHLSLPDQNSCYLCSNPPLYYIINAAIATLAKYAGFQNFISILRLCSLPYYLAYLYFADRLLRDNLRSFPMYILALALVIFWPIGATKATLINTDVPEFMAQVAGFYFLVNWWKEQKSKDLQSALLWNALALNFKNSGLLLTLIIIAAIIVRIAQKKLPARSLINRKLILVACVAICLGALPTWRNFMHYGTALPLQQMLVPNVSTAPSPTAEYTLENHLKYFLTMDVTSYFTDPFYARSMETPARNYFWDAVLKSALFGGSQWNGVVFGYALSTLYLVMIFYIVYGLFTTRGLGQECQVIMLFIGLQLLGLILFRTVWPYRAHENYRHIFAVTPVFALLYGKVIEWYDVTQHQYLKRIGMGMAALFVGMSGILVLLQTH